MYADRTRLILGILTAAISLCLARPHHGDAWDLKQPDNSLVPVLIWGDEFHQNVESIDGYTLVRDPESGWICYAELNADGTEYISTGVVYKGQTFARAHKTFGSIMGRLKSHLRITTESMQQKADVKRAQLGVESREIQWENLRARTLKKSSARVADTIWGFTLLMNFPDEQSEVPQSQTDDFFNKPGYGSSGSIAEYYEDVSNGKFYYFNSVTRFVTLDHNKSYYDTPNGYGPISEMLTDALTKADDSGFDFSNLTTDSRGRVLAFNALYAGRSQNGWANGIWPHSGSYNGNFEADGVEFRRYQLTGLGSSGASMGTIVHENGHMLFGWPDLYSYENHSNGVGRFCVMNSLNGSNPQMPNPYFRSLEDWITVTDITNAPMGTLFSHQANSHSAFVYKGESTGSPDELYFIEARLEEGRSEGLPDEGLAIWHIDEEGSNTRAGGNLHVAIEQADGQFHLENRSNSGGSNDLFHEGNVDRFYDGSSPSARWYNGQNSGLDIANISAVGPTMTFSIGTNINPFIALSTPVSGQEVEQGSVLPITWFSNITDPVKIELLKGGALVSVIDAAYTGEDSYNWTVPASAGAGSDYAIRISSTADATILSTSQGTFSIVPEFVIATFAYVQRFETFPTGESEADRWVQSTGDDLDWTVISGPTPSKEHPQGGGTGPDGDKSSGSGKYIYTEASGDNNPSKEMVLTTPKFNLRVMAGLQLSFWVHMYSEDGNMGVLHLDINVDGTWHTDVLTLTGDHGDVWFQQVVNLAPYVGDRVEFRFRAVTGTDYDSDIALDDFMIGTGITPVNSREASGLARAFISGPYLQLENIKGPVNIYSPDGSRQMNIKAGAQRVRIQNLPRGMYLVKADGFQGKFIR